MTIITVDKFQLAAGADLDAMVLQVIGWKRDPDEVLRRTLDQGLTVRDAYAGSLHDLCVIHRQEPGHSDDFGAPEMDDTADAAIACGYDETGGYMKYAAPGAGGSW